MNFGYVGAIFKEKRTNLGLSQEQLAEKVEVCVDYISKLERGERMPGLRNFVRLLNALDLSADEVLYDYLVKHYVMRQSEYIDRIGKLPKEEQERIINMMELFLDKSSKA